MKFDQFPIVITGFSGKFPQSDNCEQFWDNLINGKILYQPDEFNYPKIFSKTPKSRGALRDISKFDYRFFGFDRKSANCLDPQLRILLEVIYESLWDAGVAPENWSGSRTGFYLGSSFEETSLGVGPADSSFHFVQHFPSRVSHHFNWTGPSMIVDTACASSLNALVEAYYGLMNGTCDQAIVAGICLHLKPSVTMCFGELEMLSKTGKSKCLDESADGYIRSEAITAVVLQRKPSALRIYGTILGMATSSDGYTKEGITYPCQRVQTETMKLALQRSGVNPLQVDYVEGHVTGTSVGDPIETSAIIQAYRGSNISKPLNIGCLKGNIGHSEASAGLCALIKSLKIFQHSMIPKNIGMERPNPRIESLREGQLITSSVNKQWNGSLIGIDAFGFGGSNTHCLISASNKRYPDSFKGQSERRLICLCNRTSLGLQGMIKFIESLNYSTLNECLTLIDSIVVGTTIKSGMDYRGYLIAQTDPDRSTPLLTVETSKSINCKPLVMIFDHESGELRSDSEATERFLVPTINLCIDHCVSNGFDRSLIVNDPAINLIICQLSWVDLLVYRCQLVPKLIVATSFGSIAASYAAKQITWNDCLRLLINYVQLRGKNNPSSSTNNQSLSTQFASKLVETINLNDLIRGFENDSNVYVHLANNDDVDDNQHSNANCNNLNDAVLLNISKKLESSSCTDQQLEMYQRSVGRKVDLCNDLLNILGKLYLAGHNPDVRELTEGANLPVSSSCPSLGHLINWDHGMTFDTIVYPDFFRDSFHTVHRIDLMDPEFIDLSGYSVEGRTICPLSCYIWVIWDHLVKLRSTDLRHRYNSFEIKNLTVHKVIELSEPIELRVVSNPDDGQFTIKLAANYEPLVTGRATIEVTSNTNLGSFDYSSFNCTDDYDDQDKGQFETDDDDAVILTTEDIYFDLSIRGWKASDSFKNLTTFRSDDSRVTIKFTGNWVTFFESILITPLLLENNDSTMAIPMKVAYFRCDPLILNEGLKIQRKLGSQGNHGFNFNIDQNSKLIVTKGLITRFPEYQKIPFDLNPSELHHRYQVFLPLASDLKLNDQLQQSINTLTNTIDLQLSQSPDNQPDNCTNSKLLQTISTIVTSSDPKSMLSQSIDQIDLHFESELIATISSNLMTINLGLFEENCPSKGLLTINQIGRVTGHSYDLNCDHTFRKIRNRYKYNLQDNNTVDCDSSIWSADLIIYNHPSMGLSGLIDPETVERQQKQLMINYKSMGSSSFLLILMRENNFSFESAINQMAADKDYTAISKRQSQLTSLLFNELTDSNNDLIVISQHSITIQNVTIKSILLRKPSNHLSTINNKKPTVIYTAGQTYDWVNQLKLLVDCNQIDDSRDDKIWLIANQSYRSGLIGLALSFKEETFGHRIRSILAPGFDHERDREVFQKLRFNDLLINVRVNDDWGTYRHFELNPMDLPIVQNQSASLTWKSTDHYQHQQRSDDCGLFWLRRPSVTSDNQTIFNYNSTPCQSATNCQDNHQSSLNSNDNQFACWEFAGYNNESKKVIGICHGNGSNYVLSSDSIIIKFDIPENMPLESAVTIPIPYLIAYYCLDILSAIKPHSSILISGIYDELVDLALITICLSLNCKVYIHLVPSSSSTLIADNYCKLIPTLKDSNFIRSSHHTLDRLVSQLTNGNGVDLAINSKSTENVQLLSNCLAFGGKLIHIGTFDQPLDTNYLSDQFISKCASFTSFEPVNLFRELADESWFKNKLVLLIIHGLRDNQIKPLPFKTIRRDRITAIKCDQSTGAEVKRYRNVITIRDELTAKPIEVNCVARTQFNRDKCYILIGGLGGIGLQLTRWIVKRGARNIIITSRTGLTNQYQEFILKRLKRFCKSHKKEDDVNIVVIATPTSDYDSCASIISQAIDNYGPIGGIFNLAGILKSGLFEAQDASTFLDVCYSKVEVTEHFDKLSQLYCPQLDYFVCFSSISALGILGESNYGYANSYMERLCEDRRSKGLPGLAIQWGAIGDVGMARHLTTSIAGSDFRRVLGVINDLDKFLQHPYAVCYSVQHATKKEPMALGKGSILQRIGHILGCQNLDKLEGSTTLGSLGLDSLQAIEVQNLIDTTFNKSLSNIAILKLSITQLEEMAVEAANRLKTGENGQESAEDRTKSLAVQEPILINLTDKGTEPIFFFPPAFFDFLSMMAVANELNRTVIGVQLTDHVRSLGTFDAISQFYAETILTAYPNLKRYDFVGYSFGCTVSFELAKVLQTMIGKPSIDRIVFIDASPYGLKRLGKKTMKMFLAGYPVWEIFISTMEFMGVKIDEKTRLVLQEAEDDEIMYKELVSQILVDAGMNGPTDSLIENAAGLIDRAYYLGSMAELGSFDGDALFIQVINKVASSSGTSSLVNEGLSKIIKGSLKTVMFNATHFDILKVYAREVAAEIEKIMP